MIHGEDIYTWDVVHYAKDFAKAQKTAVPHSDSCGVLCSNTRCLFVFFTHCSIKQIRNFLCRLLVQQRYNDCTDQTCDKAREQLINTGGP